MLHQQTTTTTCLAIINKIMETESLARFRLAGGTALALKYGHRTSEDIDLFSETDFENDWLKKELGKIFPGERISQWRDMSFGVFCYLDSIKTDFMFWNDEYIAPAEIRDTIRMAADPDLFAMKLNAAFDRKSKKDFIDIALLTDIYGLQQGLEWYKQKFPYNDEMIPLKSLLHFEKADAEPDPYLFLHFNWPDCKQTITSAVKEIITNEE